MGLQNTVGESRVKNEERTNGKDEGLERKPDGMEQKGCSRKRNKLAISCH